MNDELLTATLHQIADRAHPVDGLADRALRGAARRRTVALTATALGVAAAVTVTTALPGSKAAPARPATAPGKPRLAGTDLTIRQAWFGWLPPGFHVLGTEVSKGSFTITAEAAGTAKGLPTIRLDVYSSRSEPPPVYWSDGPHKPLPATPVLGHPAHWMAKPGSSGADQPTDLRWRYGPNSSASLSTNGHIGADLTQTIYRVAEAVTFSTTQRATFPLRITGLPSTMRLTDLQYGGTGVNAGILFKFRAGDGPKSIDAQVSGDLAIWIDPEASIVGNTKPNTTIDGHPAYDPRVGKPSSDRGVTLWISGYQGRALSVRADGDAMRVLQPSGGIDGLLHRIAVLGPDPSQWTNYPLG
jgi:hypothetical protein